jgi:hypothetical protein
MAAAGGDRECKAIQSTSVSGKKGGGRERETFGLGTNESGWFGC